jgi:hypothetical protein
VIQFEGTKCDGVGIAVCLKMQEIEGHVIGYTDIVNTWASAHESSTAATISYSYEYTTSDDPETAGKKADVFLTPALNVKFSKSANISFDLKTCTASAVEIITWSLDSEKNVPVRPWFLSWFGCTCD